MKEPQQQIAAMPFAAPNTWTWCPAGPIRTSNSKDAKDQNLRNLRERTKHAISQCQFVQKQWLEGEILSITITESRVIMVTHDGKIWEQIGNKPKKQLADAWWKAKHPAWRRAVQEFVKEKGLGPLDAAIIMSKLAELPAWFPRKEASLHRIKWFHENARRMLRRRAAMKASEALPDNIIVALSNKTLKALRR